MQRVSLKGIVIGAVTNIVSAIILTLPLTLPIVAPLIKSKASPQAIADTIAITFNGSLFLFTFFSLLCGVCLVLGGYMAAKIAVHDEILNGTLASLLSVTMYQFDITVLGSVALSQNLIAMIICPVLGACGGYLRLRHVDYIRKHSKDETIPYNWRTEHMTFEEADAQIAKVAERFKDREQEVAAFKKVWKRLRRRSRRHDQVWQFEYPDVPMEPPGPSGIFIYRGPKFLGHIITDPVGASLYKEKKRAEKRKKIFQLRR